MKWLLVIIVLLSPQARADLVVQVKTPLKKVSSARIWLETDYGYVCEVNRKDLPAETNREVAYAHAKKDLLFLPLNALRNCKKVKKARA